MWKLLFIYTIFQPLIDNVGGQPVDKLCFYSFRYTMTVCVCIWHILLPMCCRCRHRGQFSQPNKPPIHDVCGCVLCAISMGMCTPIWHAFSWYAETNTKGSTRQPAVVIGSLATDDYFILYAMTLIGIVSYTTILFVRPVMQNVKSLGIDFSGEAYNACESLPFAQGTKVQLIYR